MREPKIKVGFFYKILSSKFYLTEVPVENKRTVLLHWFFWRSHSKDTMKIIRTGSCITLLSDFVPIEAKTFFRMLYFEGYAKYVFWTFNDSFIIDLSQNILLISEGNIKSCFEALKLYPKAYDEQLDNGEDPEISFCFRKLLSLKKDKKFNQMFALDVRNRKTVLRLIEERMVEMKKSEEKEKEKNLSFIEPEATNHEPGKISFLEMLIPINGSKENTLNYIESKILEARFPHNIFRPIKKQRRALTKRGLILK